MVINVSDGTYERCASVVIPDRDEDGQKLPILFDFHGSGGNRARYPGNKKGKEGNRLADIAADGQFALVGGEALQFGNRRLQSVTEECIECFVDAGCQSEGTDCERCADALREHCADYCIPEPFDSAKQAVCGTNDEIEDEGDEEIAESRGNRGRSGQWIIPEVQNDETGIVCDWENNLDLLYIDAVISKLAYMADENGNQLFDTERIYLTGCSMGSAFTVFVTQCLHQRDPSSFPAFATLGTGLKVKGDGNKFPKNHGECKDCKYFPAPVVPTQGLKLCIDNGDRDPHPNDPFFYRSQLALEQAWRDEGMSVETNYHQGGHCDVLSYDWIVECLDDGTGKLIKGGNNADCELVRYRDYDGDGFGDAAISDVLCKEEDGWVADNTDCDDNNANRYPDNTEVCDEIDNDCDELVDDEDDDVSQTTFYFDADKDGYGDANTTTLSCIAPEDYVSNGTDCNDDDITQYPGARCTWIDTDDDTLACESTYVTGDEGSCVCQSADDDSDGVCNHVDQCPGKDDSLDENEDGVPDCKEESCKPQKKNWDQRKLKVPKDNDSASTSMSFEYPAYNCSFKVDSVNERGNKFDDHVTVSYVTENRDEGEISMTGSELRKINKGVNRRQRAQWNVNLSDVIGETGVTEITVTLENAKTGSKSKCSTIGLRKVKFCGNEVTGVKPRKLEEDLE